MGDAVLERIATHLRESRLTDEALETTIAPITRLIVNVPPGPPIVITMPYGMFRSMRRCGKFKLLRHALRQWAMRNGIIYQDESGGQRFTIMGVRPPKRAREADTVLEVVPDAPSVTVETPLAFPHRALTAEEMAALKALGWVPPESQAELLAMFRVWKDRIAAHCADDATMRHQFATLQRR